MTPVVPLMPLSPLGISISLSKYLIQYFKQGEVKYITNTDGTVSVRNFGTFSNGLSYTGKHLDLDATQELPIEIPHTLGTDTKQTAILGADWVDNGSNSYTATTATSSLSALSTSTTDNVQISFTISNWTEGTVEGYGADGTYTVDVTDNSLDATGFSGDVLINSVKKITTPNAYLTYFNPDTQRYESVDVQTAPSTKYTFNNQLVGEILPTTKAFTQAELDAMTADRTLMARLAFGEDVGFGVTSADVYSYYPVTENSGEYVFDALSYGEQELLTNVNFDSDLSGWDLRQLNGATVTWEDGKAKLVPVVGNNGSDCAISQYASILNKLIKYEIDYISNSNSANVKAGWGDVILIIQANTLGKLTRAYIATSNDDRVNCFIKTHSDSPLYINYLSAKELTGKYSTISNYTDQVRENGDLSQDDVPTTMFIQNELGVPIAVDFTKLHFTEDERYIDTEWTASTSFTLTENGTEFTSTTKTMPYKVNKTSADNVTQLTEISDFTVKEN